MTSYGKIYLSWLYYWNRIWFARLRRNLKGRLEFGEDCEIWVSSLCYRGGGKVYFGKGTVLERTYFPTILDSADQSEIIFGERVYLRSKYAPNIFTCYDHARIEIGDGSGMNGCVITAKKLVRFGKKVLVSWRANIMDSDLHDLSNTRKEKVSPVEIGDYVLIGADATILPGVKIGSHCVIGAGSVVTRDIPDHSIAVGSPARVIGPIDDRDLAT